jgi:outer membrane protein assembly factor BamB
MRHKTLFLVSLVLGLSLPVRAAEVVAFRGRNRDGVFTGHLPRTRPAVAWTFATDGPVHSSPIWVDGAVVFGSGDGHLYAVDEATGKERWRFETGGGVDGPAAYVNGLLVAQSRDGNLYAVDARTGKERWRLPLGAEKPHPWGWDFYLSGPAVAGSRLFVGSGSGEVLAVDGGTGKVLWRHATAGRVRSSPAVAEGTVYVGSFDGYLYALDAESGAERWKFATQGVSIDLEEAGYDRRSVQSSPAVAGGLVVVGSRDGRLYAVDRATGKERWNFDHQISWVVSSPAVVGGRAIVGSSDGRFIHAVDLATGKEAWRTRTESNALPAPAVAGDVVVSGDASGNILGFDLGTGRELWRVATGEAVHSSPLVREGKVFIGSDDGKLYALSGDLKAEPRRSIRAVYFDARVPYRNFDGDRALRDALAAESFEVVSRRNVADFLRARIADRTPSVVVFATDVIPHGLVDEAQAGGPLIRRYLDAGGKVVWVGQVPLMLTFDPETLQLTKQSLSDLQRSKRVLGVDDNNIFEGDCIARATDLGRRWGLPAGWWIGDSPIAAEKGAVEVLATDEHGHAAAWVRRYGGPEGTGFVRIWGRRRAMPDPRVALAIAEYGLK